MVDDVIKVIEAWLIETIVVFELVMGAGLLMVGWD